jgi:hypothetical protein
MLVVSLKLVKHGLELKLTDRLLIIVVLFEPVENFLEVVQGGRQIVIIDSYRSLSVQGFDLIHDLLFVLSRLNHGVILKDSFESLGTVLLVLGDLALCCCGLVEDAHTLVHGEVGVVVVLQADRIESVKQDEAEGYEAIWVAHSVETYQRSFVG